ncbi:MAG: hypothetical protein KJ558_01900 [Gammaproteobacteria bacterium]|nr:hypothetical protein [Gammaproteobacteria bacterium]MBU1653584.1 hypothetical protein [Gammaproteobacteria bacterium]MBU1962031.1 hypothetical protein [Gammaproteobacteria bacterium]
MRVNARLDEQGEQDLKYLQQVTHTTSTDIIKTALRFYASHIRREAQQQKDALLKSGFIASFQASSHLSADYKAGLREILDAKYPAE